MSNSRKSKITNYGCNAVVGDFFLINFEELKKTIDNA